jgi:putative ABC transport system permease protein
MVPSSQIRAGSVERADARLRAGGWVALSETVARTQGAGLGDQFRLPTPTGERSFRVAALLTNLGWAPGTMILNADDVSRSWATRTPTALEIDLRDGADPEQIADQLRRRLGTKRLTVQTSEQRLSQYRRSAEQGLQRLRQIAILLLIAAAAAMAAAMGAGMWERRAAFAQQRAHGFRPGNLWRRLLSESLLVLLTACATGAVLGTYGHALSGRFLQVSLGYPAPFSPTPLQTIAACGLVALVAVVITAVVGAIVARSPIRLGLSSVP